MMNKVYKLVWSSLKNCYVVASELAKARGKSHKSISKSSVIVGMLSLALGCGMFSSSAEAVANMTRTYITDDDFYSITDSGDVVGNDVGSIAIGNGATVRNSNSNAVAIGDYVYAYETSIAIGARYDAQDWHIDGLGDRFFGTTAEGTNDIVLGPASHATGNGTIIMGSSIITSASNAVIIGQGANASANNSLALGANSIADSPNTVSFGNGSLKRKLVNIAAGTSANDAAALSQVQTVTAGTNVRLNTTTNPNGSKNQQVIVEGNGIVASGNTGLIKGGTLYSEVRPGNGTYIRQANTAAANLTALDTQAKNEATTRQTADNALSKRIGVLDGNGNYIKTDYNVAGNLRTLDNVIQSLDDNSANINLSNITNSGKTVVRNLAKEAVKVVDGENTVVSVGTDGEAVTYAVTVTANGRVADGDSGVVSGDTVYKALQDSQSGVDTLLDDKANVDASNVTGYESEWASVLGKGVVASGNTGLVNGNTMYLELRPSMGQYIRSSNSTAKNLQALDAEIVSLNDAVAGIGEDKANTNLDNITNDGQEVIRELAKDSVKVIKGEHTTVTEGESLDGKKTFAVNVVTDGRVIARDTGIVSGGTVYNAIENAKDQLGDDVDTKLEGYAKIDGSNVTKSAVWGARIGTGVVAQNNGELVTGGTVYRAVKDLSDIMSDGLDTKANADASNVGQNANVDNAEAWGEALGTGTVSEVDGRLLTGATVYQEVRPSENGEFVKMDNTTAENLAALDTQLDTLSKASQDFVSYDTASHDRITLSGPDGTVITNLKDGELSETSTDAVTGKQLFATNQELERLRDSLDESGETVRQLRTEYDETKSQVMAGFDVKADGNLVKNVNPNRNSLNFVSGNHVNVTNADSDIRIDVVADGQVAQGNTGLVTGDTVYQETRVKEDGAYVRKDNSVADNISSLDTVLKETRDLAEATAASAHDLSAVHYDTDTKDKVTLVGNAGTIITNLKDGELSAISKDAVTGKQLFETNEKVDANTQSIFDLTDKLGTVEDGAYVSSEKTFGENIGLLDTQLKTVSDGLDSVRADVNTLKDNFETGMEGKANTDLSNITTDAESVIRNLAKDAVKVTGTNLAVVTSSEAGNTTIYNVDVQADGVVEQGNTGLVNGGTVFNSLEDIRNEFSTGLDGKLNSDLSNIGLDGKEVIRDIMKDDLSLKADKTDLDTKANVDASNIDKAAWEKVLGDGVVAEGNTGLINGGTAYRAIQDVLDNQVAKADFDDRVIRFGHDTQFDGIDTVNMSKSNGDSRVLTGIATNPDDPHSAANVGYVNAVGDLLLANVNGSLERVNTKLNRVGANAAAMSALTPASFEGDEKWSLAASVGNYRSETAGAVGAFYKPAENVMMNVRGSFGTDENMVAAGVAVSLTKGDIPGVTKRQLAEKVNVQAQQMQTMEQNHRNEMAMMYNKIEQLEREVQMLKGKTN